MTITIHQPEHIPWMGFFHKIYRVDTFVILDNVQFSKNYFQNRNKIRTKDGWQWVTVPVAKTLETLIKDVTIVANLRWKDKWCDSIYFSCKKAKFFNNYFAQICSTVQKEYDKLSDLNIDLIKLLCKFLNIKTKILLASELKENGKASALLLNICKALDAKAYLSGVSGREYLNLEDFKREGINVIFQEFHHPIYKQLYEPFIPCMSVIDLLFNYGDKSLDIINGVGIPVMEEVFI